ncbi:MAG: hypothetical protein ACRDRJ_08585 [Streptosporangiaceae bacterium]
METGGQADSSMMLDALAADGSFPAWRKQLDLFGQFVGSWDIDGRFFRRDGTLETRYRGEWHFGWVLEGRAVQDVLIRPSRSLRGPGESSWEYGTTLRVFDPDSGGWLVIWIAPVSFGFVNLIGRAHEEEIWIEGHGPEGDLYRWVFSDITADRFLWQGSQSGDGGKSWFRGHEMIASRKRG